jgi:hypothetical protein
VICLATAEYEEFEASCTESLLGLQNRSAVPNLPVNAKEIWKQLQLTLQRALRAGLLKTGHYEISRLLRPVTESAWHAGGRAYAISCGPTDDKLKVPNSRECLVRDDEAVLSFSVTVGQLPGNSILELVAYRFDLAFPGANRVPFVRFDLDPPNEGHTNEGLRAHIHPGMEEGRLPSPILNPVEALQFLLMHLRER